MRPVYPGGRRAIERALMLFARGHDDHEIRFLVRRIAHPAVQEAAELLARGLRFRAQTVLDAALEGLAGPSDGSGLGWFDTDQRRLRDKVTARQKKIICPALRGTIRNKMDGCRFGIVPNCDSQVGIVP